MQPRDTDPYMAAVVLVVVLVRRPESQETEQTVVMKDASSLAGLTVLVAGCRLSEAGTYSQQPAESERPDTGYHSSSSSSMLVDILTSMGCGWHFVALLSASSCYDAGHWLPFGVADFGVGWWTVVVIARPAYQNLLDS